MQTLFEQRKETCKDSGCIFCSSLALYALVEDSPQPDAPDHVELGCLRISGMEGVLLCLSPIDAVIYQRSFNASGRKFYILPYEAIDPRTFIRAHDGLLSLYIVYGFAAHGNKLLSDTQSYPYALLYPVHVTFDLDGNPECFRIEFSEETTGWLSNLHKQAGLPDYHRLAHEQAQSSMEELDMLAASALQVANYSDEPGRKATQYAIFDPVESEWLFADLDAIKRQGGGVRV